MLRPKTFGEAVFDACEYIDLLCRQEDLGELFKEKIHLFPPDIEKEFGTKDHENKRWVDMHVMKLSCLITFL